jgi:Icc-related predicted phosphoesterase
VTRILAVADEVDEALYGERLDELRPDLVLSAGDLPFDYLEYLVSRLNVPLLYVPGNHDPDVRAPDRTFTALSPEIPDPGPPGCINVDGRVMEAAGLRVAGLGGSMRYRPGPNQYSEAQMRRRALRIRFLIRFKRARPGPRLDVLVTHGPPVGADGADSDLAHRGFPAFNDLIRDLSPQVHIHGHVHPFGVARKVHRIGRTLVVNAVPYRVIAI